MARVTDQDVLLGARALILHDLQVRDYADARAVSILEDALTARRWWVKEWPGGAEFVSGQLAQDVQDQLLDVVGRWPLCKACDAVEPHELHIEPELGADPQWVCHRSGIVVAGLGSLT